VSGPTGGGALGLPPGAWSDDTATALCIAESLLECGASDPRDQVQRFTSWQQDGHLSATGECVGITASTARALAAARWRRQVYPGSHDPKHLDPEVLCRVAPAVMFAFGSLDEAVHLACEAARITCQAPGALDACRLFAACLHAALSGESKPGILEPDVELQDATGVRARVSELREKARDRPPRAAPSAPEALAAALWAFESAKSFSDGALRAANLGGTCDVVAAVYGQLAGAHFGAQAIPAAWRSALAHRDWIEGYAERLLSHSRRR
jgi:ADP-ribosyl-[dinitrogen reductase] hydrolase